METVRLEGVISTYKHLLILVVFSLSQSDCYKQGTDIDDDGWINCDVQEEEGDCDCNDLANLIYPGAVEKCDGVDQDCDQAIDEQAVQIWYEDRDRDGFGRDDSSEELEGCQNLGWATISGDCDDESALTFPGASEICDGADNDCNGQIDDGIIGIWHEDEDADGYGSSASAQELEGCDHLGWLGNSEDCDDGNHEVYPGAEEICDGEDNDCDGQVDNIGASTWYEDSDGDGYGVDESAAVLEGCENPGWVQSPGDCDDGYDTSYPSAMEICDYRDNDCDGLIDNLELGYNCEEQDSDFDYSPSQIHAGPDGIIYLFNKLEGVIHQWDFSRHAYLAPILLDSSPIDVAFASESRRVYIAYESGFITFLDIDDDYSQQEFVQLEERALSVVSIDSNVFVAENDVLASRNYTFKADGTFVSTNRWAYYPGGYSWSSASGCVYFAIDSTDDTTVVCEVINPETGEMTGYIYSMPIGGHPYLRVIRPSRDGKQLLLGTGDILDAVSLEYESSLAEALTDALWLDSIFITLSTNEDGSTHLVEYGLDQKEYFSQDIQGRPLRILEILGQITLVLDVNGETTFQTYVAGDFDDDGIRNNVDAFPDDPSASTDVDGDSYPDAWNDGYDQDDSTTGLELDAFPDDINCYSLIQLDEDGNCGAIFAVPDYEPKDIVYGNDNVLYLFSPENNAIFRWDFEDSYHLVPIYLQEGALSIAFDPISHRLFVGYEGGSITQIALSNRCLESPFSVVWSDPKTLSMAGDSLLVWEPDNSGTMNVFSMSGEHLSARTGFIYSDQYVWDPSTDFVYYVNNLIYFTTPYRSRLDPETHQIEGVVSASYDHVYYARHPLRPSLDGELVLSGAGSFYDKESLTIQNSLEYSVVDSIWTIEGRIVTIRTDGSGETRLEEWFPNLYEYNSAGFSGKALRVFEGLTGFVVVTQYERQPTFYTYTSTNDVDSDGIDNWDDDFPIDPSASLDFDKDGYPDQWNADSFPEDSTMDLEIDAFPLDSACQTLAHAKGDGSCDIIQGIPEYQARDIVIGSDGIVYLFSRNDSKIFRWSIADSTSLNPIILKGAPLDIAFSEATSQLFLTHWDGKITVSDLVEPFTETLIGYFPTTPYEFTVAGTVLFGAEDLSGSSSRHLTYSMSGQRLDFSSGGGISEEFVWGEASGHIYHTSDLTSGDQLYQVEVDPVSGEIGYDVVSTNYAGIPIAHPLIPAPDGSYILSGEGYFYDVGDLSVNVSLPFKLKGGLWTGDQLITLRESQGGDTLLEEWAQGLTLYNTGTFSGLPLKVLTDGDAYVIVTEIDGLPSFSMYTSTDDRDGDGIVNWDDDFPSDPAASLDYDNDGYPGEWNPGYYQSDSTTSLKIDVFPEDSACQIAGHSNEDGMCEIDANIPDFFPASALLGSDEIIYMLDVEEATIHRWSVTASKYMNPIILNDVPIYMAYSADSNSLYVMSSNRRITQIHLRENPSETYFSAVVSPPAGLTAMGSIVFAADDARNDCTFYTFSSDGQLLDTNNSGMISSEYEWSGSSETLFYIEDSTTPDLVAMHVDRETGDMGYYKTSSYHDIYTARDLIRPSPDGSYVFMGSGYLYDGSTLDVTGSLGHFIEGVAWQDEGFVTIRNWNSGGTLATTHALDNDLSVVASRTFSGLPLWVFAQENLAIVLTHLNGKPAFQVFSIHL